MSFHQQRLYPTSICKSLLDTHCATSCQYTCCSYPIHTASFCSPVKIHLWNLGSCVQTVNHCLLLLSLNPALCTLSWHMSYSIMVKCLSLLLDSELLGELMPPMFSCLLFSGSAGSLVLSKSASPTDNSTDVSKDCVGCLHASMDVVRYMTM